MLCSSQNYSSVSKGYFPERNQSFRNGKGMVLIQNDKELYTEVLLWYLQQTSTSIWNVPENDDYEEDDLDKKYPDISDYD